MTKKKAVEDQDEHEAGYIAGRRATLTRILSECASGLGYKDPLAKVAALIEEREQAVAALRDLCKHYGDNDWDERLHLADVLEKHLGRHLDEMAREHGEPSR